MKKNIMFIIKVIPAAFLVSIFAFVFTENFCNSYYDNKIESVLLKTWTPTQVWTNKVQENLHQMRHVEILDINTLKLMPANFPTFAKIGVKGLVFATVINEVAFTSQDSIDSFLLSPWPAGRSISTDHHIQVLSHGKVLRLDLSGPESTSWNIAWSLIKAIATTFFAWLGLIIIISIIAGLFRLFLKNRKKEHGTDGAVVTP